MKKIILPVLFAITFLFANAQETGMHFQHQTTWANILAKAKKENKYVFVDCFTTWCGPCKQMSKNIFPMEVVGKFYNEKFVNAKLQMDKTPNDNADVKSWYTTANEFEKKYSVKAYPTYLIFNAKGELVHRFVGSMEVSEFLAKGKEALQPETQYYTQLHRFEKGERSPDFLYKFIKISQDAYDEENNKKIVDAYMATQKDYYTKENIELIAENTKSTNDTGFKMMLANPEKMDAVLGKGQSNKMAMRIILMTDIAKKYGKNETTPNWNEVQKELTVKYPSIAIEATSYFKMSFYNSKKDWANFAPAVNEYLKNYAPNAAPEQLNNYAWSIFENCNNMACIQSALEWSKQSFANNNEPGFMDTYANLLMKAGKKQEAIEWETKAIEIAKQKKDPTVGDMEETLKSFKDKINTAEEPKQMSPIKEPQ